MDAYILEAYRKKTGRKYIKTRTVTFSRDGEIANNLIFFGMCFFPFLFFTLSNDHIAFIIRKRQCLRGIKCPSLKSQKSLSESSKYLRSLCFACWLLYGNVAVKKREKSIWEKFIFRINPDLSVFTYWLYPWKWNVVGKNSNHLREQDFFFFCVNKHLLLWALSVGQSYTLQWPGLPWPRSGQVWE